MKTIPKRSDLYTNPTQKNSNIQKQMSELLQIKNMLNIKLTLLEKSITNDIFSFTTKYHPTESRNINVLNLENSLFGTDRSLCQFSIEFRQLLSKLQSEVKGVVEVLEKYSFTKNISFFITNGIMDNFLKLNDLMFQREDFCSSLMSKIQQNVLNGSGIFSKKYSQNPICVKCNSHVQKEKLIQVKEAMLLGGHNIINSYKNRVNKDSSSDQDESQLNSYNRIGKNKRKVKISLDDNNGSELISEKDMKYNLERLQNNLQQRKFDILACLTQMGQFGSSIIKQTQNIEKSTQQNVQFKESPNILSLLSPTDIIPPKFNYKQFTFDMGKYFCREIKDIESQIIGIKTKYRSLLASQMDQLHSKETQCNLGKDHYEKEIEKYKKKMQRQAFVLSARIKQIQELNKNYKSKLDEYDNAIKLHISSRFNQDTVEVEKISMQKRIARLVDRYEKKILQQQKELNYSRLAQLNSQSLAHLLKLSPNNTDTSSCLISNQKQAISKTKEQGKDKENIDLSNEEAENLQTRKKISLFLQPLIKKLYPTGSQQVGSKHSFCQILSSMGQNQNSNSTYLQEVVKLVSGNNISDTIKSMDDNKTDSFNQLIAKNLKIHSRVIQFNLAAHGHLHHQFILPRENFKQILKRQSQVLHPRQVQFLDKQINSNNQKDRQIHSKLKFQRAPQLTKIKLQQNTKSDKINSSYDEKSFLKQQKRSQNNNGIIKRYASEHSASALQYQATSSHSKNMKQKSNKKIIKALSLTILKKGQQDQQAKGSVKLPTISQQQKWTHKLQKLKQMQKPQLNSKNTLLTKKKRKKRHFSQETLLMDSLFDNQGMTMSLGNNIEKQLKKNKKKEYIIDFIPKIEEQNMSKCKQEQFSTIQNQIEGLFDIMQKKDSSKPQNFKKSKYIAQTGQTKGDNQFKPLQKLNKQEIYLSTNIYTIMAAIKSIDVGLYKSVRQKLKQQYRMRQRIKTNCDQLSMTMPIGQKDTNHFPLSLSMNPAELQGCESSFDCHKVHQTMSTNSNELDIQNSRKKQNKPISHLNLDQTELRKIINFLIVKHRHLCSSSQKIHEIIKNSNVKACQHIYTFYHSLLEVANK